jgi:hypothetical protein
VGRRRARDRNPSFASLSAGARYGDTGGSPTRFDDFAIGGAPPRSCRRGWIAPIRNPVLPADVQVGHRSRPGAWSSPGNTVPIVLYADWARAWNGGGLRPDPVRVAGAEVRLERLIPPEFGRAVTCRIGGGWITSDVPCIRAARGYAQLIYRP